MEKYKAIGGGIPHQKATEDLKIKQTLANVLICIANELAEINQTLKTLKPKAKESNNE